MNPESSDTNKFFKHFESLNDPRVNNRNMRHNMSDILLLTVIAVICGAEGWVDVERFGKAKLKFLKSFLMLPNGIPSHDILGDLFSRLCPDTLQSCFLSWVESMVSLSQGEIVAIDGKTLRRSFNKPGKKGAIHMVSAWATGNQLVLGQYKVDEKSNEITAIPELLKLLNLSGSIVTIDAMGCQKKIAKAIRKADADYVLAVKDNQKILHNEIKTCFDAVIDDDFLSDKVAYTETLDKNHGRIETRRCWILADVDWITGVENWEDLITIGVVESERHEISTDETSIERRYYISSISADAALFSMAVRKHWGVENSLHWCLDVTFREDDSRIRKGFAAQNMAVVRHIALNFLKKEKSKTSIRGKRKKAGWDENFLLKVLADAIG
jgi:predicted transposase YbfD/YdcC